MLCFVISALLVKIVQCIDYVLVEIHQTHSCMRFWTPLKKCPHDQVFRRIQSLRLQTTYGNDRRLLIPFRIYCMVPHLR